MAKFFTIDKHSEFGKLVHKWAKNEEKRPGKPKKFMKLLAKFGITATFPDANSQMGKVRRVKYVDLENDEILVVIPSPKMLRLGLQETSVGGQYPFPSEYLTAFPCLPEDLDTDEAKEMFYARIGDYSIGLCM